MSGELDEWASRADKHPPVLEHRNRRGEAVQRIDKDPAYVALERVAYSGLETASLSHGSDSVPPLVKYALTFLFVQAEFGLCCPVSMTDSLTRTLRRFGDPALVARYLPMLASRDFDTLWGRDVHDRAGGGFRRRPDHDAGDARDRRARRDPLAPDRRQVVLFERGRRNRDGARAARRRAGRHQELALFLLPKTLPDGTRNRYRIVRLKDKLGSRSMASGEIALEGAQAYLIGEIGRGFHQMADMINMSRLSNGVRARGG